MLKHGKKTHTIIDEIKIFISKSIKKNAIRLVALGVNVNEININVEKTKDHKFGDYSTNVAMSMSNDRDTVMKIAKMIAKTLNNFFFKKIEILQPGFINFFICDEINNLVIEEIISARENYGRFPHKKTFYNLEFVSANPTGLLHIGHARNAAFGDTLANI
jgi:arginyl-tRNA synthetase